MSLTQRPNLFDPKTSSLLVPHLRTHPSIQPILMGQLTYSDRASELFKPPCRDNRDSKASRSSRAGKALEVHVQNDKTAALHNLISTAARGRATFPRTTGFCARERRRSVPNPTTFLGVLNTLSSMYYRSVQSRLGIPCCDSPDTIQFFKRLEPFINCQRQAKRLVLHF